MSRAMLKSLTQAFSIPFRTCSTPRVAVIGGTGTESAPLRQMHPVRSSPRREPATIVQLPVGVHPHVARPRAVATADLKVKQFRGRHVEDERYTATLHATSVAPAALLAALADATREIEAFGCESLLDEHLVMHFTIRR